MLLRAVLLLGLSAAALIGVEALSSAEVQEIRHFASRAYGAGRGPSAGLAPPRGSFSHYVGRRMKALTVQRPYTVVMKPARPAPRPARPFPVLEPQAAGAVNSYSFLPNFLAPRPFQGPPPPSKFRFGGGPSFSYSFPPGPPPPGFSRRPPPPPFYQHGGPPQNGQLQPLPQVQALHDQKPYSEQGLKVQKTEETKVKEESKGKEGQEKGPKVSPEGPKEGQFSSNPPKFNSGISYAPQTFEQMPPEIFTRHLVPAEWTIAPNQMQVAGFQVPIRYERLPPVAFQYINRPSAPPPPPLQMVYQTQAFPDYSFHSHPNNNYNFVRFQSFVQPQFGLVAPSVVPQPTAAVKPLTPASVPEETKVEEGQELVFQSARIPEEVARRPGGAVQGRPQPLTPEEQRNVFTAAADSSMVVAPLVYTENSASPISGEVKTSTRTSTSRSKKKEESTVTKVLPGGKRVRLRKVRVSPKPKPVSTSSA